METKTDKKFTQIFNSVEFYYNSSGNIIKNDDIIIAEKCSSGNIANALLAHFKLPKTASNKSICNAFYLQNCYKNLM